MRFSVAAMLSSDHRVAMERITATASSDVLIVEMQLAHEEKSETRAAYNRSQKLKDRRAMMQAWADYIDQLRSTPGK